MYHSSRDVRNFVHGDDIVFEGEDLERVTSVIEATFIVKV